MLFPISFRWTQTLTSFSSVTGFGRAESRRSLFSGLLAKVISRSNPVHTIRRLISEYSCSGLPRQNYCAATIVAA
ncbi:hypothetical protein K503DRAFT_324298 [Rhizopogon vinicolor AM-OR11-026]|uniref:Uncharacterized protein n=1 Tax=Rhizopogon vinicolor AM-OR11-026 TaxID=1314800 RepID=A0A1B7MU49_9AGAM|nr:hypothetical protein K503DRAFT_324298 [Rhizopogon vinicolor AM-OR11-026]